MRDLPDPDISLREARDFIFSSALGRKALSVAGWPNWPIALHDLIEVIHRLVQSCHLQEFTDHGLVHLCSLVDRLSLWECTNGTLVASLSNEESATLLLAVLLHDLGMLSQNEADMPDDSPAWEASHHMKHIADWVRQTHVTRLPKLSKRIFEHAHHSAFADSPELKLSVDIASAHQEWPWKWHGDWLANNRNRGLAALVAVADLLDEDAARCDTSTLLRHRDGTALNRAHWLRHTLTTNRILVNKGGISVKMQKPPGTDHILLPVFVALRNHFRLVIIYNTDLQFVNAPIDNIDFCPCTGLPSTTNDSLGEWNTLPEYGTLRALCHHLLHSFMPEALRDTQKLNAEHLSHFQAAALEDVDLSNLRDLTGTKDPGTDIEATFGALLGTHA